MTVLVGYILCFMVISYKFHLVNCINFRYGSVGCLLYFFVFFYFSLRDEPIIML